MMANGIIEITVIWLSGLFVGLGVMSVVWNSVVNARKPKRDARRRFAKRGN